MHVNLWSSGKIFKYSGKPTSLLTPMHNLAQLFISSLRYQFNSQSVVTTLMEDVVLSYGICAAIVIDDNIKL